MVTPFDKTGGWTRVARLSVVSWIIVPVAAAILLTIEWRWNIVLHPLFLMKVGDKSLMTAAVLGGALNGATFGHSWREGDGVFSWRHVVVTFSIFALLSAIYLLVRSPVIGLYNRIEQNPISMWVALIVFYVSTFASIAAFTRWIENILVRRQ